jgi:hypothetical protein
MKMRAYGLLSKLGRPFRFVAVILKQTPGGVRGRAGKLGLKSKKKSRS